MKKSLTLIVLTMCMTVAATAQDVIVTKKSERIDAKIIEVSDKEVRYKKQGNPDGPTFTIQTRQIATITYANGDVQTFGKGDSNPFDSNWFNFLPENTNVTRSFGAHISYVLPDPSKTTEGRHYKFPSTEISLTYGYYFNDRLYTGITAGILDFTRKRKERIEETSNNYVDSRLADIPVRNTMMGIPLGIDLRYAFGTKKVKPVVGARLGFTIPLVSSQRSIGETELFHGSYGHYGGSYITEGYDAFYREIARAEEEWLAGFWGGINVGARINKVSIGLELVYDRYKYEHTTVTKERYYGHPDGEEYDSYDRKSGYGFLNLAVSIDIFNTKIK